MLTILFNRPTGSSVPTGPPASINRPVIIGVVQIGQVLTTTNGTWTNSPTSFAYQWQQDGTTNIAGATGNTYTITAADVGHTLNSVVTATNTFGSGSASSLPTVKVPSVSRRAEEGGRGLRRRRKPDKRKETDRYNEEALAIIAIMELESWPS